MSVSSIRDHFVQFDQSFRSVLTPLPKEGKMWEVAKRVAIVAAAPFVYLAMAIVYAIDYLSKTYKVAPPTAGTGPTGTAPSAHQNHIETLNIVNFVMQREIIDKFRAILLPGNIVAVDVLVKVKIGDEVLREGHLNFRRSAFIDFDSFQQKVETLFSDLQNSLNADHRSSKLDTAWFGICRNHEGNFSGFRGKKDMVGKDVSVSYLPLGTNKPLEIASPIYLRQAVEGNFDENFLWALIRRDVQEDYEQLVTL